MLGGAGFVAEIVRLPILAADTRRGELALLTWQVLARVEAGDPVLLPRERAEVGRVSRMSALLETRLIALDPLIALFHR